PDDFYYRSEKALAVESSPRLAHLLGVNGFFTALTREARHSDGRCRLAEWRSERDFAARWGDLVRPDGYGRWHEDGAEVRFCLELDNGTENLARLVDKLAGYSDLGVALDEAPLVLFAFRGLRREAAAAKALSRPPVPVATAVIEPGTSPAGPYWRLVGRAGCRQRLAVLGEVADEMPEPPR
ncbi:MAG: replication-relaxation family protein, partial [Acidimicrobiales bacterium]